MELYLRWLDRYERRPGEELPITRQLQDQYRNFLIQKYIILRNDVKIIIRLKCTDCWPKHPFSLYLIALSDHKGYYVNKYL